MSTTVPATHPAVVLRSHYRNLRSLAAVLAVAVVGLTATVVIQAVDEDQPVGTTVTSTHPAQLSDPYQGRTQPLTAESAARSYPTLEDTFQSQAEVPRSESKPDESAVAAGITAQPPVSGPDESRIAAAIGSGSGTTSVSRPDEAKIAAELDEHGDVGPASRAQAYQEALRTMTPEQVERAYGAQK